MKCTDCGGYTCTVYQKYDGIPLCKECYNRKYQAELDLKSENVKKASDFSEWKNRDMSELFWIHLGRYINDPNERSLSIIRMAYMWACHDNHGLANSFSNAMRWAKIDLHTEEQRWRDCK